MRELLSMVEALPEQEGKDAVLRKVRELIGEPEEPEYRLVISDSPYMAYEVRTGAEGGWCWSWTDDGDGESDGACGFTTYRDTVRAIKKDVQENLACDYDERVSLIQTLDMEVR